MAAPNLKEIEWAIQTLEQEESSEKRYSLLAALYTCRNEMLERNGQRPQISAYSNAGNAKSEIVGRYGDSEFLETIEGLSPEHVWPIIDELMETLRMVKPQVYNSVMRRLRAL